MTQDEYHDEIEGHRVRHAAEEAKTGGELIVRFYRDEPALAGTGLEHGPLADREGHLAWAMGTTPVAEAPLKEQLAAERAAETGSSRNPQRSKA